MLALADASRLPFSDTLFHCIAFSPPYWGLRKYAGEQGRGLFPNLGLEATPEEHIEHMVAVCGELKRVLRDDGVMYMNYGDCYSGSGGENGNLGLGIDSSEKHGLYRSNPRKSKQKGGNLMLMPHRVALALQADGWILRQDLVWSKPNPMPESVNGWRWEREKRKVGNRGRGGEDWRDNSSDTSQQIHDAKGNFLRDAIWECGPDFVLRRGSWRHTRSHEYVFMFVKSMGYYCNQEAVRVPHAQSSMERGYPKGGHGKHLKNKDEKAYATSFNQMLVDKGKRPTPGGCNPRDVLHIPTAPYKGSHYATYPPNLIRPLILASCPQRCCPECGQAWAPVVESDRAVSGYRPTCECGEWHCKCGAYAIQYRSRKDEIDAIQRQGESEGLSKSMGTQPIYIKRDRKAENKRKRTPVCKDMHTVPKGLYGTQRQPILQSEMCCKVHARKQSSKQIPKREYSHKWLPKRIQTIQFLRLQNIKRLQTSSYSESPMDNKRLLPILREGICPQCGEKLVHIPFNWVPGIVFDPFMGSGTTGQVARELGLRWVGTDISFEYLNEQAKPRAAKLTPSDALDELPLFSIDRDEN